MVASGVGLSAEDSHDLAGDLVGNARMLASASSVTLVPTSSNCPTTCTSAQIHHGAELGVMRDLYQHHRAKTALLTTTDCMVTVVLQLTGT